MDNNFGLEMGISTPAISSGRSARVNNGVDGLRPPGSAGMNVGTRIIDALKELSNIASGNAATALSKMLTAPTTVDIKIDSVEIDEIDKYTPMRETAESEVLVIRSVLSGDLDGSIYFVLPATCINSLFENIEGVNILERIPNSLSDFDEMQLSALREIGNILISHYLGGIADFLEIRIFHDIPKIAIDNFAAVMNQELAGAVIDSDKIAVLHSFFRINKIKFRTYIFLVLREKSLEILGEYLDPERIFGRTAKRMEQIPEREERKKIRGKITDDEEKTFEKVIPQSEYKPPEEELVELEITERDLDAFRELGNIGAGNAGNALSQLLNKKVLLEIPPARIMTLSEMLKKYSKNKIFIGYIGQIRGETEATAILMFPMKHMEILLRVLLDDNTLTLSRAHPPKGNRKSAIAELLNILMGHDISALTNFARIKIEPPEYRYFFENLRKLFTVENIDVSDPDTKAIVIETGLVIPDLQKIKGLFILLITSDRAAALIKKLEEVWS